jgi:hypothetical protein
MDGANSHIKIKTGAVTKDGMVVTREHIAEIMDTTRTKTTVGQISQFRTQDGVSHLITKVTDQGRNRIAVVGDISNQIIRKTGVTVKDGDFIIDFVFSLYFFYDIRFKG